MSHIPTREEAWGLLKEYVPSENLRCHALAVESVMRHFAKLFHEDEELWGIIGLVHDLDYEKFPNDHCKKVIEILRANDWPEEYIRSVVSHGWGLCSEVEPLTNLEKTLFAIDELTGLITASTLVRPSKSILDLQVKSVMKKWKEKSFAAGADRSVIEKGAEMLDMELSELIGATIEGMKPAAESIGLKGIQTISNNL